ncbi:DUF475 domain-containing protein [Novosphingobium album (ex Liu et al. 2023)]|uniref:DUF475 domain-containing protein n=1 Tax=Novosphingobium album (ex Liu et al. 2023) TaxID=3031130 RepID=A0ABT5WSV1_9SPHN|nr:DUF475 domain-containing protein [Novosphingobium album (ex Liu et al. 2023)]MDE8652317.1 DUF475 domain-containing protein [Novosphingobium album (ex Liu et al. 2023)]
MFKYYKGSFIFTAICLAIAAWLGWGMTGALMGTLGILWIVAVLGVLEVSLSFDNAVVNATVLRDMDAVWRRRFLTWGIVIAVFGMRIIFPLAIVAVAARMGPIDAIILAASDPVRYEQIITDAHVGISGFGGAFLAMVGLTFFLDEDKDVHWIGVIERPFSDLSRISGLAIGIVLLVLYGMSRLIGPEEAMTFIASGIFGLLTYIAVQSVGALLEQEEHVADAAGTVARSGLAGFLYLEVLDASFSFDGVIGAFALSNNLFIIALGLGIGAMFVRSMTVMLVDKGTLAEYRFLEHGAFYAIVALAAIMLLSVRFAIPETVTGLIGAALIGLAFYDSLRSNRRDATPVTATGEHLDHT